MLVFKLREASQKRFILFTSFEHEVSRFVREDVKTQTQTSENRLLKENREHGRE